MRRARRIAFLLLAASALAAPVVSPRPAAAQEEAPYKQHMRNGVKLYEDKNYVAAIAEFEAAYKAEAKASPLVNLALCYKNQFDYPKAIASLELALSRHGAAMSAGDKKAAEDAITEMRGLLAFVTLRVTPPGATISVDGEEKLPGATSSPIAMGPGSHKIGAQAKGFASAETSVTLVSGEKKTVTLALTPDMGWLVLRGGDARTALFLDGKQVATGQWADLVAPGSHVVQMVQPGRPPYLVDVLVVAGKSQEIRPGFGGTPHVGTVPALPPPLPIDVPPPPKKIEPPAPPMRGFFALATASLLVPTAHPVHFPNADPNSGAAGGLRVGYRVNTPASFDLMFEYGNVTADTDKTAVGEVDYSLSSTRFSLNLRLMTPGKTVRMVGTIGGGFALSDLSAYTDYTGKASFCPDDCTGADPFLLGEIGLELDFGGVLVGLSGQSYFQSTKGMETGDDEPYGNDPLIFLGGGLRVGYGTW